MNTARIRQAVGIALGLFVVFNANFRTINSVDSRVIQHTALAVAATGRGDLTPYTGVVTSGVAAGYIAVREGRAVSSYPLLPALFAAPAYRVALTLGLIDAKAPQPGRLEAIGKLTASAIVSLACAVLYLVLTIWRPRAPAATIALASGLATPLWSSASQALWSHGPAALLLALALGCLLAVRPDARLRTRAVFFAGVFIALAVFSRQLLAVFPPGIAIGLWRSGEPRSRLLAFVTGAAASALVMVFANEVVLGSALGGFLQLYSSGVTVDTHGVTSAWSGNWLEGMAGVLASPSRGILIYTPIVLLSAAASRGAWREGGLTRYGLVLPTAMYIVVWAKYAVWWGGHSYGPRLAADLAVPFGLIAATAFAKWSSARALPRVVAVVALAWSVAVQGIGAICYPSGEWNGQPKDVDQHHERLWDWRDSQLIRTLQDGPYRGRRPSSE